MGEFVRHQNICHTQSPNLDLFYCSNFQPMSRTLRPILVPCGYPDQMVPSGTWQCNAMLGPLQCWDAWGTWITIGTKVWKMCTPIPEHLLKFRFGVSAPPEPAEGCPPEHRPSLIFWDSAQSAHSWLHHGSDGPCRRLHSPSAVE